MRSLRLLYKTVLQGNYYIRQIKEEGKFAPENKNDATTPAVFGFSYFHFCVFNHLSLSRSLHLNTHRCLKYLHYPKHAHRAHMAQDLPPSLAAEGQAKDLRGSKMVLERWG